MADEGKDTFTADEVEQLIAERNAALEAKRDELLNEVKDVKTKLRGYDGVDPTKYRELEQKVTELEQQQAAQKHGITSEALAKMRGEVEADLLARFAKMAPKELASKLPQVKDLAADNRALRLDQVVKAQMAKAGARPERIDALYKLAADEFDLTEDGQPMLRNRPGVEVDKYVAEDLKATYPELYMGSGSSGGGASKSNASGGGVKTIAADDSDAFMKNLEAIADGSIEVTPA